VKLNGDTSNYFATLRWLKLLLVSGKVNLFYDLWLFFIEVLMAVGVTDGS
jgi:hypothetical protein